MQHSNMRMICRIFWPDRQNVTCGQQNPAQSLSPTLKERSAVAFNNKFIYLDLSSTFGSAINNLNDYER